MSVICLYEIFYGENLLNRINFVTENKWIFFTTLNNLIFACVGVKICLLVFLRNAKKINTQNIFFANFSDLQEVFLSVLQSSTFLPDSYFKNISDFSSSKLSVAVKNEIKTTKRNHKNNKKYFFLLFMSSWDANRLGIFLCKTCGRGRWKTMMPLFRKFRRGLRDTPDFDQKFDF